MTKKMPEDGSMVFPVKTSRIGFEFPVLEGVEHGTVPAYAKGCRCGACRAAKAEKNREYRERAKHPNGGRYAAGTEKPKAVEAEKPKADFAEASAEVSEAAGGIGAAVAGAQEPRRTVAYLAGPITGIEGYRERFAEAARAVEEAAGWAVLHPSWIPDGVPYESCMRIDAAAIRESDIVVVLPGWRDSRGTMREMAFAIEAGKPVTSLASVAGGAE